MRWRVVRISSLLPRIASGERALMPGLATAAAAAARAARSTCQSRAVTDLASDVFLDNPTLTLAAARHTCKTWRRCGFTSQTHCMHFVLGSLVALASDNRAGALRLRPAAIPALSAEKERSATCVADTRLSRWTALGHRRKLPAAVPVAEGAAAAGIEGDRRGIPVAAVGLREKER